MSTVEELAIVVKKTTETVNCLSKSVLVLFEEVEQLKRQQNGKE